MGWFSAKPKENWKYVGRVKASWVSSHNSEKKGIVYVNMYMTDDGKRRVDWNVTNRLNKFREWPKGQELQSWESGGPFPSSDFEPEVDTLGQMLRRLVDIQMGLTDGGKDET